MNAFKGASTKEEKDTRAANEGTKIPLNLSLITCSFDDASTHGRSWAANLQKESYPTEMFFPVPEPTVRHRVNQDLVTNLTQNGRIRQEAWTDSMGVQTRPSDN